MFISGWSPLPMLLCVTRFCLGKFGRNSLLSHRASRIQDALWQVSVKALPVSAIDWLSRSPPAVGVARLLMGLFFPLGTTSSVQSSSPHFGPDTDAHRLIGATGNRSTGPLGGWLDDGSHPRKNSGMFQGPCGSSSRWTTGSGGLCPAISGSLISHILVEAIGPDHCL